MKIGKKGITVLVAEDNPYDFETTNRKLNYLESVHEIIHLADGNEVINYVFRKGKYASSENYIKPDLILLDIMMPHMTGIQVLQKINEEGSDEMKSIPVIMLTSLEDNPSNKSCFEYGAKGFLNKPVSIEYFKDFIIDLGLNELVHN